MELPKETYPSRAAVVVALVQNAMVDPLAVEGSFYNVRRPYRPVVVEQLVEEGVVGSDVHAYPTHERPHK